MSTLWHMEIDIQATLKKTDEQLNFFSCEGGERVTGREARQYLEICLAKGWKVFPVGDCPTFCYLNGCPGHEESEDVKL